MSHIQKHLLQLLNEVDKEAQIKGVVGLVLMRIRRTPPRYIVTDRPVFPTLC